jgi:hypothetical protein
VRLQHGGASAVDAGLALRVQAPPAEAAAEVLRVDRGEAAMRVDRLDAVTDVEAAVVLLHALVGVERLAVADGPLALAARPPRGSRRRRRSLGGGIFCDGHQVRRPLDSGTTLRHQPSTI